MNKSLQYLLATFGVLLLLFFINQSQQNKYQISSESIFSVNEENIFQISLHDSNGDSLVLVKTDTSWTMPQADTLKMRDRQIDQFFEKVVNGTYDMVMSKNPEKWEKFGVTDSLGKTVNLFDENGTLLSSVIFSNKGQDYSHNFYRVVSENEVYNLTIPRGTLTPEERKVINDHIVVTIKMLEELPYPKHLQNVPEFAGGHHETLDGTGYPKGLTKDEMSVQARIMAIADIFEALTARDRPYKKGKTLSQAMRILGFMKNDAHIDADLFEIFVKEKIYMKYAEGFLDPEQIDEVKI